MASQKKTQWLLRLASGQIKGPLTTDEVLENIRDGHLVGDEHICKFPNGDWVPLSTEAKFYDYLLDSIETERLSQVKQASSFKKTSEETIFMPPPPDDQDKVSTLIEKSEGTKPTAKVPSQRPEQTRTNVESNAQVNSPLSLQSEGTSSKPVHMHASATLELEQRLQSKKSAGLSSFSKIIAITLIVCAVGFVLWPDSKPSSVASLRLIAPKAKGEPMAESEFKNQFDHAVSLIQLDRIESYAEAESLLVRLVEASPTQLEVRALLCLTYKEIWPYSFQDAQDRKTITMVAQSTRTLDLLSPYGSLCEATRLQTQGQIREARGVIDAALDSVRSSNWLSLVFQFKAELLEAEHDYLSAAPYYEKVIEQFPGWAKPYIDLGNLFYKTKEFPKAAEKLNFVLSKISAQKRAKTILGLVQYNGFAQIDQGVNTLISALSLAGRIPRATEIEASLILAQSFEQKGDKKKALKYASRAIELAPSDESIKQLYLRLGGKDNGKQNLQKNSELVFLGDQYAQQGNCLAAQAEYKAAFDLDPKNAIAATRAAKCLWKINSASGAKEWLYKAIKADPKYASAYVLLSDYLSQRYDFQGAGNLLTSAARVLPQNPEILKGIALLEYRKNNFAGAINSAQRSLRIFDGDAETYVILAKAHYAIASSIQVIGKNEAEQKQKSLKEARLSASKAIELESTDVEAQVTYAQILSLIDGTDTGINYLNELIKMYSYSLEYRIALADMYRSEERFTQAKEMYERILHVEPKNKKALMGMADCLKALALPDAAIRNYLQAAIADPNDATPIFSLAKIYLETGKFNEAIKQFKRVIETNPYYPKANMYVGRAAFGASDFTTAMEFVNKEKKLNPNLSEPYVLAGDILYARKKFSDCATEYSGAIKLGTQPAEVYVKAARCYRQSGSLDVADDMLELAKQRESGYADIYRELGLIYEFRGDGASAAAAYNKYLGLAPNAPDRADIERRLLKLGQ